MDASRIAKGVARISLLLPPVSYRGSYMQQCTFSKHLEAKSSEDPRQDQESQRCFHFDFVFLTPPTLRSNDLATPAPMSVTTILVFS